MVQELSFTTTPEIEAALVRLARTEDVAFSPNAKRPALVGLFSERILVLDVRVSSGTDGPRVELTGGAELTSDALKLPHGGAFLDDQHVIVTNRQGDVTIFAVPPGDPAVTVHHLTPIARWPAR